MLLALSLGSYSWFACVRCLAVRPSSAAMWTAGVVVYKACFLAYYSVFQDRVGTCDKPLMPFISAGQAA